MMGVTILFFAGLAVIAVWWLSTQRLTSKPWLEQGSAGEFAGTGVSSVPMAKVGLGVLLAAIGSLFALFISAYFMRMQIADWRAVPKPTLLWVNTGMLMLSSAALQWARMKADRNDISGVRAALLGGGAAAFLFIAGQLLAWRQLGEAGYFLTSNPASSFFYLITALHGVHVLGGIVALGRNVARAWQGRDLARLRLGLDLCSLYWDFLLLMWLVLFGLLLLS
jgi:cytochrome c oxidase subunit III